MSFSRTSLEKCIFSAGITYDTTGGVANGYANEQTERPPPSRTMPLPAINTQHQISPSNVCWPIPRFPIPMQPNFAAPISGPITSLDYSALAAGTQHGAAFNSAYMNVPLQLQVRKENSSKTITFKINAYPGRRS